MRWMLVLVLVGCRPEEISFTKTWSFKQPDVSQLDPVGDGQLFFLRTWEAGDPLLRSDGPQSPRNASSCVACHSQGGIGGSGGLQHNVVTTTETGVPVGFHGLGSAPVRFETIDTVRNTPALFGIGALDAIDETTLQALAMTSYADYPEVTGKVSRGLLEPSRFGWKGQTPDLETFVRDACRVEVGLLTGPNRLGADVELDATQLDSLVSYVASLPAPTVPELTVQQRRGLAVFGEVGCATCHVPDVGEVPGVFSDLLLHDMGQRLSDPDGAALGYGGGLGALGLGGLFGASPSEWRTPPLWGVADSAPYLHDGRASTLSQAIHLHEGEAWRIRRDFERRPRADRDAVLAFLGALRSPVMAAADEEACVDADDGVVAVLP